jgi:hypothetical protein
VRSAAASSPSLFELPAAAGPRRARIFVVVTLNLILAGAGIAMIASYLSAWAEAEERARPVGKRVEAPPPVQEAAPVGQTPVPETLLASSVGSSVAPPAGAAEAESESAEADQSSTERRSGGSEAKKSAGGGIDLAAPVDPWPDAGAGGSTPARRSRDQEAAWLRGKIGELAGANRGQLQRCASGALKTTPAGEPLAGQVDIRFRIMPDGRSTAVRSIANTTSSPALAECLVDVVEGWTFPAGAEGPHDFVWPFRFRAVAEPDK